jgi:hypothetical protein
VLEAVQLPAGIAHLDAGLAHVDADGFTHFEWVWGWGGSLESGGLRGCDDLCCR